MTSITIPEGASIQSSNRVVYGAAINTGPFSIPFPYFDEADIVVYDDGVLQTLGTNYTITGVAVDGGFSSGEVNFTSSVTTSELIFLRDVPIERLSDFLASGPFPMDTLNVTLDKLFAIQQQLRTTIDRAVRLDDIDPTLNVVLPAVDTRKGNYLFFDEITGAPAAAQNLEAGSAVISAYVKPILDSASQVAFLSAIGTWNKFQIWGLAGTDTAAASDFQPATDGTNYVLVTAGAATINALYTTYRGVGNRLILEMDTTVTIANQGAASASFAAINTISGSDLACVAGDVVEFIRGDDGDWNMVNYVPATAPTWRGALAYETSDQSIPTATFTDVLYGFEEYDTEGSPGIYNVADGDGRMTVPAGVTKVRLTAQNRWKADVGSGWRETAITKNGAVFTGTPRAVTEDSILSGVQDPEANIVTPVLEVTAGDYFNVTVYQNSGGNRNVFAGVDRTWFAMEIIE